MLLKNCYRLRSQGCVPQQDLRHTTLEEKLATVSSTSVSMMHRSKWQQLKRLNLNRIWTEPSPSLNEYNWWEKPTFNGCPWCSRNQLQKPCLQWCQQTKTLGWNSYSSGFWRRLLTAINHTEEKGFGATRVFVDNSVNAFWKMLNINLIVQMLKLWPSFLLYPLIP